MSRSREGWTLVAVAAAAAVVASAATAMAMRRRVSSPEIGSIEERTAALEEAHAAREAALADMAMQVRDLSGPSTRIHELEPPRISLATLPTRVIPLPLSVIGCEDRESEIEVHVKLDSETSCLMTGNKVRKLEYLLADARARGATTVITCGGYQSNHCRATVVACARAGLRASLLLRAPAGAAAPGPAEMHAYSGNARLIAKSGADVTWTTAEVYGDPEARAKAMAAVAAGVRAAGGVPYVVPEGGSNALGSWGYVRMLAEECDATGCLPWDTVVVAVGSGGTLAGLLLARALLGLEVRVLGIVVCDDASHFRGRVSEIFQEFNGLYGTALEPGLYELNDAYIGPGYGLPCEGQEATMDQVMAAMGVLLDVSYGGKAMHALKSELQQGRLGGGRLLFVHTGGAFHEMLLS